MALWFLEQLLWGTELELLALEQLPLPGQGTGMAKSSSLSSVCHSTGNAVQELVEEVRPQQCCG